MAILALAAVVRCQHVAVLSFDFDEAYSWKMTTFPLSEIADRISRDLPPPLYFYLLWGWSRVFGGAPETLRSLSVLFGLVAVAASYLLAREVGSGTRESSGGEGEFAALAAAAMVAFSPLQVDFSQRVRMYSLGAALALTSCWLLLRALRASRPRWRDFIWYALAAAALAYTHSAGLLVLAAQFLYAVGCLLQRGREPRRTTGRPHRGPIPEGERDSPAIPPTRFLTLSPSRLTVRRRSQAPLSHPTRVGFAFAVMALLWLPWAPSFLRQCEQASRSYPGSPFRWQEVARACYQTLAVRWEDDPSSAWTAWGAAAVCLLMPAAMLLRGRGGLRLIGLCVLATFDGAICFSVAGQNVIQSRYFVFAHALLLAGLPALLLGRTNPKRQRGEATDARRLRFGLVLRGAALVGIVAGMAWLCLAHAERRDGFAQRPGMLGAMAYLAEARHPDEPLVVSNPMLQITAAAHAAVMARGPSQFGQSHSTSQAGGTAAPQVLAESRAFPYFQGTPVMRQEEFLSPFELDKLPVRRVWAIDAVDWISPEWKVVLPPCWIEVSALPFREWPGDGCRIIVRCYERKKKHES